MSTVSRGKRLVARRGPTVAVLLAAVGVLALAGAGWLLLNPPTDTVVQQRGAQTFAAGGASSAVVTGNSTLYDQGERLRNRSVYLRGATPELTLTVGATLPADSAANATQRLTLVLQGTRDGQPFWRQERLLLDRMVAPGAGPANTTLDVPAVADRLARAREEVGGVGEFDATLRLRTTYRSDRYEGRLNATAPLTITEQAYWIDGSLAAERTKSRTVTQTVTGRTDPVAVGGLGFAGLVALAGAGWVTRYHRRLDADAVETEVTRSQYDEWISDGEFPSGPDKRYIRIESLEDLVDVAIDSNKRVIYDDVYQAFAVADDDLVYYFTTDIDRVAPWLNM